MTGTRRKCRLIRAALDQDMPIFAICRGIQALNVALGGTLYQDLPSERPSDIVHAQNKHDLPRHETAMLLPSNRIRASPTSWARRRCT